MCIEHLVSGVRADSSAVWNVVSHKDALELIGVYHDESRKTNPAIQSTKPCFRLVCHESDKDDVKCHAGNRSNYDSVDAHAFVFDTWLSHAHTKCAENAAYIVTQTFVELLALPWYDPLERAVRKYLEDRENMIVFFMDAEKIGDDWMKNHLENLAVDWSGFSAASCVCIGVPYEQYHQACCEVGTSVGETTLVKSKVMTMVKYYQYTIAQTAAIFKVLYAFHSNFEFDRERMRALFKSPEELKFFNDKVGTKTTLHGAYQENLCGFMRKSSWYPVPRGDSGIYTCQPTAHRDQTKRDLQFTQLCANVIQSLLTICAKPEFKYQPDVRTLQTMYAEVLLTHTHSPYQLWYDSLKEGKSHKAMGKLDKIHFKNDALQMIRCHYKYDPEAKPEAKQPAKKYADAITWMKLSHEDKRVDKIVSQAIALCDQHPEWTSGVLDPKTNEIDTCGIRDIPFMFTRTTKYTRYRLVTSYGKFRVLSQVEEGMQLLLARRPKLSFEYITKQMISTVLTELHKQNVTASTTMKGCERELQNIIVCTCLYVLRTMSKMAYGEVGDPDADASDQNDNDNKQSTSSSSSSSATPVKRKRKRSKTTDNKHNSSVEKWTDMYDIAKPVKIGMFPVYVWAVARPCLVFQLAKHLNGCSLTTTSAEWRSCVQTTVDKLSAPSSKLFDFNIECNISMYTAAMATVTAWESRCLRESSSTKAQRTTGTHVHDNNADSTADDDEDFTNPHAQ
jgi:hypothetical protein